MKKKSSLRLSHIFLLLCLILAGAGAYVLMHDMTGPVLNLVPENPERLGPAQPLELTLSDESGLRSVQVTVRKNGKSMTVLRRDFPPEIHDAKLNFDLSETRLPDGEFELEIRAWDTAFAGFGSGNSTTLSLPVRMDTQPPRIAVRTVPPAIRRGGCAVIVYTINKDVAETGVRSDDLFFPAYKQADGSWACLFAFPHQKTTANYYPEIMARDDAGNITSSRLLINAIGRNFTSDTLPISENFLNQKAQELARLCPEKQNASTLEQYICVNNGERLRDDAKLLELGQKSNPSFLWSGKFQHLPRSAVKANFGDSRTYTSGGKKIDHQVHTGLDLASVARAEVPAANAGRVIFAEELGIYGNIVVIDHGLGLMTLYSHLSEFRVKPGDEVKGGQIIGTTGTTGLAAGDHVHFGVLVSGVPVQPLEWLDAKWVQNNITSRMKK